MAKHHETEAEERHEEEKKERDHEKKAHGGATHESHSGHRTVSSGFELENEGEHPGDKRGGKTHRGHRARGGKAKHEEPVQEYNAKGSHEVHEAEDETPEFKKGGHKKHKAGGMVGGGVSAPRIDRRARGGHVKRARGGGSPYSSGANITGPSDKGRGKESDGPA